MLVADQIYSNDGLNPLYDGAMLDDVALPAGVLYPKGQLLAPVAGSGTAVNDVQTMTITGTSSGGTDAIFWAGQYVGTLVWNSTAAQAKVVFDAFFGVGNTTITGGPWPGTPLVITFTGGSAGLFQPLLTHISALTGTSPVNTITHTTSGAPAGGFFTAYIDGTADPARRALRYASATDWQGFITNGNASLQGTSFVPLVRGAPAYFKGIFRASDLVGLDANGVVDLGKLINGTAFNSANAIVSIL